MQQRRDRLNFTSDLAIAYVSTNEHVVCNPACTHRHESGIGPNALKAVTAQSERRHERPTW